MKAIIYYILVCCFCYLSSKYIKEGLGAKKYYIDYKEKKKSIYKFTKINQITNEPINSEDYYKKIGVKEKKKKIKVVPKADTVVRVTVVEHLIEPKKITPDTLRVVKDTTRYKSKIKISKSQ